MLRLENVSKTLGARRILDQVSLTVEKDIHVIIGLNGSGKSSLLKVAAGVWRPDSGRIQVNGREITSLPPEDRLVGYVPQNPALFPHLSVAKNIRYCRRNGRGSEQLIKDLIRILDLSEVLEKPPHTLSGGYQSRVSLARTLASSPEVMLMDEPLSDLDVAIKMRLIPDFRKALKAQGLPVIYVTHDLMEAKQMGDRFSVMIQGVRTDVATAEEAFDQIKHHLVHSNSGALGA